MNTIKLDAAVTENMGNVRKNNEDNFYLNGTYLTAENRDTAATFVSEYGGDVLVYGVFDGMGGEALGEEASYLAASTVHDVRSEAGFSDAPEVGICRAIELANDRICNKMLETGEKRIGTTFAAVTVKDDKARVCNIGDSRVYLLRDGVLCQVSVDDTNGQRLLNMGIITKEQLATHKDRHKLTQHLGIFKNEMTIEPHISAEIMLQKGDKLLLCSDGLTDMVDDEGIEQILSCEMSASELTCALVSQALANGGRDNVTAMVIIAETQSKNKVKPIKASAQKTGKASVGMIVAIILLALIAAVVVMLILPALKSSGDGSEVTDMDSSDTEETSADTTESVTEPVDPFGGAMISIGELEHIEVGDSGVLRLILPEGAEEQDVTFSSSDEFVLTVYPTSGKFAAQKSGVVTVTAESEEGSVSCLIQVYSKAEELIINGSKPIKCEVGDAVNIGDYVSILPADAYQNVELSVSVVNSGEAEIISVDENGIITCKAAGEGAEILVKVSDEIYGLAFIDVSEPESEVVVRKNRYATKENRFLDYADLRPSALRDSIEASESTESD